MKNGAAIKTSNYGWDIFAEQTMMFLSSISSGTLTAPQPVLTVEEQIAQAEGNIEFLKDVWENNEEVRETIDEEDWEGMIESIEESIEELEDSL